ncbi:phage tail protein [Edwardsiella ictaluri]|uniref:Putative Tail fiber assembly protein-like protein n=1 Tax=Edwardsiella ictaluri (strain 93-146) TaxID=634503 RepID=C5BH15_EDWI9|nr:tail fiber assembly protein [Edwardsiella ictaluri]ACR69446.1 putative Tail fiber assembly protein-like protein [Edwardsiella ictaluri 93-146]AVZ83539.1 phage tail protein [Edwardsiella ictaluri]EKS7764169.1 tail fiber assembly protein [Edwardsiella ictaluri]EKS7771028.1 tail fiber assembly protein [Edwardsiella ictaluri]EKS7774120.1 tail fiber assembly protein [Edwardsiella ictaluri]
MKYPLTPEVAELGKNRLAKKAGWLTVYHTDEATGEYTGASYEFILEDTGLPANAYTDAPTEPAAGYAIVRSPDRKTWQHVPDHRGETVFDTRTGKPVTVSMPGNYPQYTTPLQPDTPYDVWNGEKWVTDTRQQQQHITANHLRKKNALLETATQRIEILMDKISLTATDTPTQTIQERLLAWRKYRAQVDDISADTPHIDWPAMPE